MIETGTLLQDRYLIEKKIGAGGMGAVYLAVDQRFDNYVAIKETFYKDEELAEAFEREARLLNGLQHPVLPHVSDYFTENNGYFLVMRFIEGEDLSDILKLKGAFPAADVLRWTDQLLDALDYLHSQEPPIIHRDIKPHNLKLTPRGELMLLDFGLAKLNYEDTAGAISVFGYSRTYSPLEQIQGTGTDARSDIFALGATVYHLLTGRPPVDALTRAAAIVNEKTDPLQLASEINPEIPFSLASLLNSALALNPQNRFITAQAMRQALEFAGNEDSKNEISEKNPAAFVAAVPAGQIINPADDDKFTALESFAADNRENLRAVANQSGAEMISARSPVVLEADEIKPAAHSPYSTMIVNVPTKASAGAGLTGRKPALFGVLGAVLIFAFALFWYFSAREHPVAETNPPPAAKTSPAAKSDRETSEKSSSEVKDKSSEIKSQPATAVKTAKKADEQAEAETGIVAEENSGSSELQRAPSTRRKKEVVADGETDAAGADEEKSPDAAQIESIFTGRDNTRSNATNKNQRRPADNRLPNEMSQEESDQMRRERKQKRGQKRNDPIPF